MRRLQGGRVVDPVAGHRHHLAVGLQRLDDAQLLRRQDAGEDAHPTQAAAQRVGRQGRDLLPRHDAGRDVETGGAGDGQGRRRVVAGDHHHLDAGAARLLQRRRRIRPEGIDEAEQAGEPEGDVLRFVGEAALRPGRSHAQHAQAQGRVAFDDLLKTGDFRLGQAAEPEDRLRSSLGGGDAGVARKPPQLDHGEQFGPQRPGPLGLLVEQRLLSRCVAAQGVHGPVHRIDGANRGRQGGVAEEIGRGACRRAPAVQGEIGPVRPDPGHLHAVLGQGAGLVDAEHSGSAERLDDGAAARQHPVSGQAPGAEGEEDRQHHGEFLGDQGDRHGDARQRPADPVVAQQPVGDGDDPAEGDRKQAQHPDQPPGRLLEWRGLVVDRRQRGADPPQRRPFPRAGHLHHALAPDQQRAGEHERSLLGAGRRRLAQRLVANGRPLDDRSGLAGQGGLVDAEDVAGDKRPVGGNPLAFADQQDVARDQLARRDPLLGAVADHPRMRLGQLAQRRERAFAARLLHDHQADRRDRAADQEQPFAEIAEEQVEDGRADQQQEHRFAQGLLNDAPQGTTAAAADLVRADRPETPAGLGAAQSGQASGVHAVLPSSHKRRSEPGGSGGLRSSAATPRTRAH